MPDAVWSVPSRKDRHAEANGICLVNVTMVSPVITIDPLQGVFVKVGKLLFNTKKTPDFIDLKFNVQHAPAALNK